jgi:hypothetical protein
MAVSAEALAWRSDFENALKEAAAGRLVLLDFSAAPT